ncbi:MAG: FtsH protease activity modulator HflK, partial [Nevskia sp.]|nr:FtsH protease activity modulator HflK [Nevskia sp.]
MAWNEPGGSNNRDPWSQGPGGKRGDAQPDLNELLKRFRARWGGRGGKGPGGVSVLLGAALLVLLWLLAGFYTVDEQDRGVVIRLGAYARTVGPGLHWHLPPPFEHVKRINVTTPHQAAVQSELLTKDQNLLDVGLSVQFRVSSAEDNIFNVDRPNDTLQYAARSALQQVIAGYTIDQVLGDQQNAIANRVREVLQRTLDTYHCGLQVTDLSLTKPEPPEAVQAAFYDTIKATEDQKRARNEAQAYAAGVLPKARADAARSATEAQAYRDQAIARAEGDTARFSALLQEYRKSPQVTRKRLYLETMSEIYASTGKVLVDVDKGNPTFTVPLQPLLGSPPAAAESAPAEGAPPSAAASAP